MTSKSNKSAERADEADDHSSMANGDATVERLGAESPLDMPQAPVSLTSVGVALQKADEKTKRLLSQATSGLSRLPDQGLGLVDAVARFESASSGAAEWKRMHRLIQGHAEEMGRFHTAVQRTYQHIFDSITPLASPVGPLASMSFTDQYAVAARVHQAQLEQVARMARISLGSDSLASFRSAMERICEPLAGVGRLAEIASLQQQEALKWLRAPQLADFGRESIAQIQKVIDSLSKVPGLSAYPSLSSGYIGTAYRASSDASAFVLPRPMRSSSADSRPDRREESGRERPKRKLLELDEESMALIGLLQLAEKRGIPRDEILRLILDMMATGERKPQSPARLGQPQGSSETVLLEAFAGTTNAERTGTQDERRPNAASGQWVVARNVPAVAHFAFAFGHDRDRGPISKDEYSTLAAARGHYDFFIDGIERKYFKRTSHEVPHQDGRLTAAEYAIIQKLIVKGGIRRPGSLHEGGSPEARSAVRQCELARQKVDIRKSRHEYTLIRTHKRALGGEVAFEFAPQEDIRWLLIEPHFQ